MNYRKRRGSKELFSIVQKDRWTAAKTCTIGVISPSRNLLVERVELDRRVLYDTRQFSNFRDVLNKKPFAIFQSEGFCIETLDKTSLN